MPGTGDAKSTPHRSPNHCLVNEYLPGQGIMPHEDGDAYAGVVATVTLGAVGVLEVFEKAAEGETELTGRRPRWRVLQEERSLLVTRGVAYRDLLHGIAETEVDGDLFPAGSGAEAGVDAVDGVGDEGDGNCADTDGGHGLDGNLGHTVHTHVEESTRATATSDVIGIANWDLLGNAARFTDAGGNMRRGTRISLTWRDVLKVSKVGQLLFGRPR